MQNNCAVFRTQDVLEEGRELITKVYNDLPNIGISDRSLIWNTDLAETFELNNLLYQSLATLYSANERTESRGSHARDDYPDRNDEDWLKHTMVWVNKDGTSKFDFKPVELNTLTDEVETVQLKARTY